MREAGTASIPLRAILKGSADGGGTRAPREGLRLGRYELLVPIARGGMAEVWIARFLGELGFSRVVALKTIRPEYAEDPSFREGFFEEARVAARLRHANVIEVLELGEEGSILFQVMTLIEGDSLAKLLLAHQERAVGGSDARVGLPVELALRIMSDTLAGLHAAHELTDDEGVPMRLVHRDVTPHNILLGADGVAKLGDFGVAKVLGRRMMETQVGQIRGKLGYLAPEQIEARPLDRRCDLFAAGIVLFEMITGRRLFRGEESRPALADVMSGPIPDPREFASQLAPELAAAVLRALARDPVQRFATAAEMAEALELAAKKSGMLATSRELAEWVRSLCSARLEEQREAVRRALRGAADRAHAAEDSTPGPAPVPSEPNLPSPVLTDPASIREALRQVVATSDRGAPITGEMTAVTDLGSPPAVLPAKKASPPLHRRALAVVALALASAALVAFLALRGPRSVDPASREEPAVTRGSSVESRSSARGSAATSSAAASSTAHSAEREGASPGSGAHRSPSRAQKKRLRSKVR